MSKQQRLIRSLYCNERTIERGVEAAEDRGDWTEADELRDDLDEVRAELLAAKLEQRRQS